ncbi:MarR family winged helix-turn-helix transcriptional regulator [Tellurirhabdus bombi]|uniref:MarR family winged helix-turn-helix transcriptional regulator n=1 Tax=Tellurirhabdus bombi TaxID=2907205 RepID=UPI001F2D8E1B|nr:MarR family transcriptional regulator [Tellurirhabdus bombi]
MSELLKLENQVCFPVYSLAKEIVNHYRPLLEEMDVTYPQYLVMLVLWEHQEQTVSQIGEKVSLDSGTLTPLLKRLEQKGLVSRVRSSEDERVVQIKLTEQGKALQEKAALVPEQLANSMKASVAELIQLKKLIDQILANIK